MGGGNWSDDAYKHITNSYSTKSTDDIFTSNKTKKANSDMLPAGVKFRECRDSVAHPNAFGVCVFLDVTGSMGRIPEELVRGKLGTLMESLIKHGINDAQVLFGAIGDHISDNFPLQVGQFESGTEELNKWLSSVYIEGNGGGQSKESYSLSWLFGARHTSLDAFEKRNIKSLLFTIGDESAHAILEGSKLRDLMGYTESTDITDADILAEAQRMYHVFHIHVNEGNYRDDANVLGYWRKALGERLIICNDYNQIAELISSTVAIIHGIDLDTFTSSFDPKTAIDVKSALAKVNNSVAKTNGGVINL
ncbi:MAG TPA: hypothetical protein VN026_17900 [Bacteroidia bacterium]|jgi:hypothetical protein|nr:hypothetical protein [Bacteroidia bacterium]